MDKGQTAVLLSIFILVGMVFLVPAMTEKALAGVNAVARFEGCEHCTWTVYGSSLQSGKWVERPTVSSSGDTVTWKTTGNPPGGNEEGVVNLEGHGQAHGIKHLTFNNPWFGRNSCSTSALTGGTNFGGSCDAGYGNNADFTYTYRLFKH